MKKPKFELLDLTFMTEISRGDVDYERQVTKVFIEIIPEDLAELKKNVESNSIQNLKKTLHHMQSSVSIMGLDKKLSAYMDIDTYEEVNSKVIKEKIDFITATCTKAIDEATIYLKTLSELVIFC